MRGPKTELDALWARLAPPPEPSPISPMQLHLQNQIIRREVGDLHAAVRQMRGQLSELHGIVLHQQTGQPPDPSVVKKIMDALRK